MAATPEERVDVAGSRALIQAERVTVVDVVPSLLDALLREPAFTRASSLRRVLCGGEAISPTLVDRFRAQLSAELVNFYGPTEATIAATWWPVLPGPDLTQVPIGRPIANTTIHLLDSSRNRVPVGVPGEIYIGGIGVGRGYLHADDLTTQRFVPDGFSSDPNSRLFRTGDRGRHRPDGAVEFLGRVDDQIKLRGFRIEPGEIETVLQRHPGVEAAVVTSTEVGAAGIAARDSSNVQALEAALDGLPTVVAEELIDGIERTTNRSEGWLRPRPEEWRRRNRGIEIMIRADSTAVVTPSPAQRRWWIDRTGEETLADLEHLDALASTLVPGSTRPVIDGRLNTSGAKLNADSLIIQGQQVMQAWERPLMEAMAAIAAASHGDVLEIGFGLGLSATFLQVTGIRSHTIVESNDEVCAMARRWRDQYPDRDIRIVHSTWQDAMAALAQFDAILFDAYPQDEPDFAETAIKSVTFAENFFQPAAERLRPNGVFTYYTNEIDTFSRRHQRAILKHFRSLTISVVRGLQPPPDCHYWWADSMVVVGAIR